MQEAARRDAQVLLPRRRLSLQNERVDPQIFSATRPNAARRASHAVHSMTTHLEPVAKDGEFLAVSGTGRRMWSIAVAGRPSSWIVLMIVHRSSTGCEVTVDGTRRADIHPGLRVMVVLKPDQRSGKLTEGVVKDILTKSATHSRGVKVRLETGEVGRVREIVSDDQMQEPDWSEVT